MSATTAGTSKNYIDKIRFGDLVKREEKALAQLKNEKESLEQRKRRTLDEDRDLDRITKLLSRFNTAHKLELVYSLYVATRDYFNANEGLIGKEVFNHDDGHLVIENDKGGISDIVKISLVLGLLAIDEVQPPRLIVKKTSKAGDSEISVDPTDSVNTSFSSAFFAAFGEVIGILDLAQKVLPILANEGDPKSTTTVDGTVDTAEFAYVIRCLRKKGINDEEPQLKRRVSECLDKIQKVGVDKPLSDIGIALPDLNSVTDYQIEPENVRQVGVWIYVAMFKELKVYEVVDKLVEQAQDGTLVLTAGKANEMLYQHWKSTPNRLSDVERDRFLAITLGIPGGPPSGMYNDQFNDQWIRFASSISSLIRQKTADQILRANIPAAISQQQVRKTARDLALNLSSHAYGMSHFVAREEQALINFIIELLSDKEMLRAIGADNIWQIIDKVATLELGGARNTARYSTLANCGAIITAWLANNVHKYKSATSRRIIDVDEVLSSDPATAGSEATTKPTDYDLVNACELWLAETATSDARIEELSQPRESPTMTSRPVQIPSIAREMLDQAGVNVPGFGMGMGMRR